VCKSERQKEKAVGTRLVDPLVTTRIIRLFPRQTSATPDDPLSVVNRMPGFFDEADEVHISVTWTWDLPRAEELAKAWEHAAPVKIGGPATGAAGGDFTPGQYVKTGYVITSRGCPNRCWFCSVWKREGTLRELPITEGWNVLDDNLIACSDEHIKAVFSMLSRQKQPIQFTGGLEAARLKPWIAEGLRALKPKQMFFAYDTPDDLEPLRIAGKLLLDVGFTTASHTLRCYVFCGYKGDTMTAAEKRMKEAMEVGFVPMAMLWRNDKTGLKNTDWIPFQRQWARPAIICR
jgi:hypothetical protein